MIIVLMKCQSILYNTHNILIKSFYKYSNIFMSNCTYGYITLKIDGTC